MNYFPELELPGITWSAPSPSAGANLYLGIDNTQPNSLRVFALGTDGFCFGYPIGGRRFKDGPTFRAWWEKRASQCHPAALATTKVPHDPFDSLAWLEAQALSIRRYHSDELADGFIKAPSIVPKHLIVSYSLAFRVIYECEISGILDMLNSSLKYHEDSIAEMKRELWRIQSAMPSPF